MPESHRPIADFFGRDGFDVSKRDGHAGDPRVAAALRRIESKAPIALRVASELIDRGADLPIDRAVQLELDHLEEIFSTGDAYEGLSSVGKRPPVFKGA